MTALPANWRTLDAGDPALDRLVAECAGWRVVQVMESGPYGTGGVLRAFEFYTPDGEPCIRAVRRVDERAKNFWSHWEIPDGARFSTDANARLPLGYNEWMETCEANDGYTYARILPHVPGLPHSAWEHNPPHETAPTLALARVRAFLAHVERAAAKGANHRE